MQSRWTSLLENLNRSVISGGTAAVLHYLILESNKDWGNSETNGIQAAVTWAIMFANSMVWGYFIRRMYNNHHVKLDAASLVRGLIGRIRSQRQKPRQ